jgi:protein arginine N-methyltransferase 1
VFSFGQMILDETRMEAYTKALRLAIQPGCSVVDIGTGTGIFALLACQYGAGRVYAIEPNDSIALAEEIAAANGYADRITFFQKLSTEVQLPESVDVIVSDMRGVLPLLDNHIPSIVDARQRFLKPGGILIPGQDRLLSAPVEVPDVYRKFSAPWKREKHGLVMDAARDLVVNTWTGIRLKTAQFLAPPVAWAEIDYATVEQPDISNKISWVVERSGTMHGVGMWFETTLLGDIGFSSQSDERELVYGNAFFPFPEEVAVERGECVTVSLRADLIDDDYQWTWRTSVFSSTDTRSPRVNFKQSTFQGIPLSRASLRQRQKDYAPGLNADGVITHQALQSMAEGKSMDTIAQQILADHPGRFQSAGQAFSHVVRLVEKYGGR